MEWLTRIYSGMCFNRCNKVVAGISIAVPLAHSGNSHSVVRQWDVLQEGA